MYYCLYRALALALVISFSASCAHLSHTNDSREPVRIALFNIKELSTEKLTNVDANGEGQDAQAQAAAAIIQRVNPDVLVLNEIDLDWNGTVTPDVDWTVNARRFNDNYLAHGSNAVDYQYAYAAPSNTGLLSGHDFDNDGTIATADDVGERAHGNDSFGYGVYPGQYAMAILCKYPIAEEDVRTFQRFLWKDLPGNHLPREFYSAEEQQVFRLSSKSHWDVPVAINGEQIHLLVSHPTPPVFDGDEDRNGRRNFDEIKFWVHYINDDQAIYDDTGVTGGLASDAKFIIAGDLNASRKSDSQYDGTYAIDLLLTNPRIQETAAYTRSHGAPENNPAATAAFREGTRVDYVLPSAGLELIGGGVFWPAEETDPAGAALTAEASDHRMVWIDVLP